MCLLSGGLRGIRRRWCSRRRGWGVGRGRGLPWGATRFNLEEGMGPVEVTLEGEPTAPSFLWMRHGAATFGSELTNRAAFARALGLAESDLLAGAPICTGSTGNTLLYVPLRDRERGGSGAARRPPPAGPPR